MAKYTGLINPRVVKNFLNRDLDSWDWMKKESRKDIRKAVKGLKPRPDFGNVKLRTSQLVVFLLCVYLKRFMIFGDMGFGKTLLILMLIQYLKQKGENPKAIIFVPYVITVDTWIEETEKWTNLKCVPLLGSSKENLETLNTVEGDLYVASYQTAVAMLAKRVASKKKGKKEEWKLESAKVRKFFKSFNLMAMDEVHKIKNHQSSYYRMCRAISKEVEYCFGLTGTPHGRSPEDMWAEFNVIDFGETLGSTLGLFRSAFFEQKDKYWGGVEYKFKKTMKKVLGRMIKHRSIRYSIKEVTDMPPKQYVKKYVASNEAIQGYYTKIAKSLGDLSFGKVAYREQESKYNKLRQLSSGFMTLNGDDKSKVEIEFPHNPKMDALQELIETMPEGSKMIVFHHFVYTNEIISKRLKAMKVPHARVWGKGKDNLKELRRFKKDPNCRVLVINTQSGSSSQNLQMANYVVYYEQPQGSIDREQSERRAWRPGQLKTVFFIDLLMKDTYDENMLQANAEGRDLLADILDKRHALVPDNTNRKKKQRVRVA